MNMSDLSFARRASIIISGMILGGNLLVAAPQELPPLTTVSGSPPLPGKFVWADLSPTTPSSLKNFTALSSAGSFTTTAATSSG